MFKLFDLHVYIMVLFLFGCVYFILATLFLQVASFDTL